MKCGDIFGYAFLSVLIPAACYWMYRTGMNNWATDKMYDRWEFWTARMKIKGYTLASLPGGYDDAPCEVRFSITSEDVRIHGASIDIFRLVRKIDKGQLTKLDLVAKSTWPYEEIPR